MWTATALPDAPTTAISRFTPSSSVLRREHRLPERLHRLDFRGQLLRRHARVLRAVEPQRVLDLAELAVGIAGFLRDFPVDQPQVGGDAEQGDVAEVFG